ncbi:MAG: hypothetical protein ACRER2_03930 [Methylococcales bacterium]
MDEFESLLRTVRRLENQYWHRNLPKLYQTERDALATISQRVRQVLADPDSATDLASRVTTNLRAYFPGHAVSLRDLCFWSDYCNVFFSHISEFERYRQKVIYILDIATHSAIQLGELILDDLNSETNVGWTLSNIAVLKGVDTALHADEVESVLRNPTTKMVLCLVSSLDAWNDHLLEKLWAIHAFERVARRSKFRMIPVARGSSEVTVADIMDCDPFKLPLPLISAQ